MFLGLVLLSILFFQCSSSEFEDNDSNELFSIVSDENGDYLSFSSENELVKVINLLDKNKAIEVQGFSDFVSLRSLEQEREIDPLLSYPCQSMAQILNPEGIIKLGGILYQDFENGKEVYTINGSKKDLYFSSKSAVEIRSSCLRQDDSNADYHMCGIIEDFEVYGKIDHYTYWWYGGYERVFLKTRLRRQACNGAGGWKAAHGTINFDYDYSLEIDGDTNSGSGNLTRYSDNYHSITLGSGWDVCIDFVDCTHSGSWNNASATTYTYVD